MIRRLLPVLRLLLVLLVLLLLLLLLLLLQSVLQYVVRRRLLQRRSGVGRSAGLGWGIRNGAGWCLASGELAIGAGRLRLRRQRR